MTALRLFCAVEELQEWTRLLCGRWELACLSFDGRSEQGRWSLSPAEIAVAEATRSLFLCPVDQVRTEVSAMNSVRPRDWGWIDIRPGGVLRSGPKPTLLMSELHGEDFDREVVHPARFVSWLRKTLTKQGSITFGVRGRNTSTGGEEHYRDLAFTPGALRLRQKGCEWAQFPNGRVIFEPADQASAS